MKYPLNCRCNPLILLLFLLASSPLFAQTSGALFNNYFVRDGLTDKTIHVVFQDSQGWIWIGTDFGVLRFDGYEFSKLEVNNNRESDILSNSLIREIYEDSKGVIWIGTELHGVFSYDRYVYKIEQVNKSLLSNNSVWSIVEDNGRLWFATEAGLNCYNPKTNKVEITINSETQPGLLSDDFVRKIYIDNNNKIWVGTGSGITVLNPNYTLNKRMLLNRNISDELENEVWEIFQDNNDNMWFGTYLGGLVKYNISTDELTKIKLDKSNTRALTVRSIVQDRRGDLWIGTRGGLYFLNSKTNSIKSYHENVMDDFSLVHNSVLDLRVDAKGDLWIGTRNGISFLNFERQAFGYLNSFNSGNTTLNNNEVYALWEDANKNIWIGTESGGINILNRKTNSVSYLTTKDGLSNNCVKAIAPDNNGNVLIGTYLGGLNIYNPKTGENTIFTHEENNPKSLSDNSVWVIFTDSQNRIWVGTSAGLDLFDPISRTFTHYGEMYELGWVSMIYEDPNERLWIYSGDFKRLTMITQSGKVKHFPYKSRAMTHDHDGNLWISTMGDGLIRYNPVKNETKYYTTNEGLCSNVIYGLIKLEGDEMWLSTNNGLSYFDLQNETFKNYYVSDGLLNDQFNYAAALKCSGNTLAFGGKKGVDFVYLSELQENEYIPPVVLTDFRIFNKKIPIGSEDHKYALDNFISEIDHVTLPHHQNMITFEFAALNYANSEKNSYRYMLEGFDKEWNEIGSNHSATYTNIDFGDYTFRVIGTNSDNKFDPNGLSFRLTIQPPFWKTWVFRFIVIGIIGGLLYLIYIFIVNREKLKHELYYERKNARQMQELDRLKHQFFMNISHEIRTPLSLIVGPLDKLLHTEISKEVMLSHLGIIKRNTNILLKLVNQLLDYRKLETGNLKLDLQPGNLCSFVQEIVTPFQQLAQDRNIELEYNIAHKSIFFAFDADKLEKIINNLLSNAIKYTNAEGKVVLSVSLAFIDELENVSNYIPPVDLENSNINQYVKIIVRDTGIGIPKNQIQRIFDRFRQIDNRNKQSSGAGIGLSLTKELVKLHNGHIKVKSIEGKGSKFTLLLPYIQLDSKETVSADNLNGEILDDTTDKVFSDYTDGRAGKNTPLLVIVDDNPDIRKFVKHHFEPEYQIIEAKDGKEGWDAALDAIPDLIIADIMMPIMDGVELCKRIKNDERTSHIPVLLLTALSSKEKQLAGISAGADDYIVKPFDVALLKAKVDNMLYIRKALRERFSKELLLKPKDIVLTSPDEKFLRKVISVIEKNISQPELDVDFLAKQVGVSRTQLYRKLNALTDMAAKEFVKDIRLKRAGQLLSQNKLNISEVALEVGFNDISYFRKCFKDKYGMSASEYIKNPVQR